MRPGDTVQFYILHNTDSALTEIVGVSKNVNFTDEYIAAHNGKHDVKIPEVHELANILVALSDIGRIDSNLVDMTTPYYQDVIRHFLPYRHHSIVNLVDKHIRKPRDHQSYFVLLQFENECLRISL